MILVNLAVLTLFVGLATLQFDSINSGLVGERLVVLAGRTAAPFQAAAKIGLPISTVRNADALLECARQTGDAILAIHVFDAAAPTPADDGTGELRQLLDAAESRYRATGRALAATRGGAK